MSETEIVLGEIPVVARLALGSERLGLFVTTTRIIVAHVGKRGTGAVATTAFFGRLSGAIEDVFKGCRESLDKRKLAEPSPGQILAADKDNFHIDYGEVVNIDVDQTPSLTGIVILTKREKLEFYTRMKFESAVELLDKATGPKVRTSKLGP
jgi:hypothetical protein